VQGREGLPRELAEGGSGMTEPAPATSALKELLTGLNVRMALAEAAESLFKTVDGGQLDDGAQVTVGEVRRLLTQLASNRLDPDARYILWSGWRQMWWREHGFGYTRDIELAGRFGEYEALTIVRSSADSGDRSKVTRMVRAPEDWPTPAEAAD
jgi:hypothetical protein